MTGQDVVAEARKWTGTPWKHQGRSVHGIDCVGLIIKVAHGLGLSDYDVTGYGRVPDGRELRHLIELHLDADAPDVPGAVLLMRFMREPQHLAIRTDRGLIHAYAHVGKVIETSLDSRWTKRIVGAYRFRGVWPS